MNDMKDQERERFRVRVQARIDQALSEKDEVTRKNLLEHLKKHYETHLPDLFAFLKPKTEYKSAPKQEAILPRTENPEHNRILEQCEANLKNVNPELRGVFFRVAQQQIARSVAPLSIYEKKQLPPEKLSELEKDPVQARQFIFKKENQEEKPKLSKGMRRTNLHTIEKEPPRWIVEGILPEGLTLLGSRPYGGKSLMMALLVEKLIRGEKFLGRFQAEIGDALYFDFEKVEQEILSRVEKIAPLKDDSIKGEATYFAIDTEGQPQTQEELVSLCDAHLEQYPKTKIVIIDTLARIKPEKTGGDTDYDWETKVLGKLQNWAKKRRISLIALLHTTKHFSEKASNPFDALMGSVGLQGVSDCCWLLLRPKGFLEPYGELLIQNKIGGQNHSFELFLDGAEWKMVGDLKRDQAPKTARSVKKETPKEESVIAPKETIQSGGDDIEKILNFLESGAKTPKEVCEKLGKISEEEQLKTRKLLLKMKSSGVIKQEKNRGPYFV